MQMDDDPPESVTRAQHLIWFYFLKVLKYIYFYNWTRMLHVHRRRPHINNYSFYPYIIALHCGLGLSLLVMVWKTLAFRFLSELVTTFASNPLFCSLPLGVLFLLRFIFELVSYPRFYFQLCVYVSRHDRSSGHSETNINLIKKFYNCWLAPSDVKAAIIFLNTQYFSKIKVNGESWLVRTLLRIFRNLTFLLWLASEWKKNKVFVNKSKPTM